MSSSCQLSTTVISGLLDLLLDHLGRHPCPETATNQVFRAGVVAYRQRWPTPAPAIEEGARKHAELEREGVGVSLVTD